MNPLSDNCRAYADDGGKVTGVDLDYYPMPDTEYELLKCELVEEVQAHGETVAYISVYDENNLPTQEPVWLAWPYDIGGKLPSRFPHRLPPGNNHTPFEHMITNGYSPPDKGPLAIYVGHTDGRYNSDVVAGVGLPYKHHVSFRLVYRKRTGVAPPQPHPDPHEVETTGTAHTALAARVQALEDWVKSF